jgi:TRAP-type C4-dicarboxylate transport system permease small subunit
MKPKGVLQTEESKTFFDRILNLSSTLSIAMIFFVMLSLCVHVVMRYVLNKPQNWTIDVACIVLLCITMFAAGWVQRFEGHVSIDFIFAYLSKKSQIKLHIFNSIICAISFIMVAVYGFKETLTAYRMDLIAGMPLEPPKWILTITIPIGFLLLLIQYLRRIRSLAKQLDSADQETGGPSASNSTPYLR